VIAPRAATFTTSSAAELGQARKDHNDVRSE
jgi:hypothetical protein